MRKNLYNITDKIMSKNSASYTPTFYADKNEGSYKSAKEILSYLIPSLKINSMIDFGCGTGSWLKAAKELGCKDCLGLEGKWVKNQIDNQFRKNIKFVNLEKPITINKQYDLAISLEVAEHLSSQRAQSFVNDICRCSSIVLFSAAFPGQGGTLHKNEQWPSYWVNKFFKKNYILLDAIRPLVRSNRDIENWYRTNTLLFVSVKKMNKIFKNKKSVIYQNADIEQVKDFKSSLKNLSSAFDLCRKHFKNSLFKKIKRLK